MKAEVNPLAVIAITLVAIVGSVFITQTIESISPPQAEQIHESLPSLVIEEVTSKGEVYIRNLKNTPATVDTIYIKDASGETLLYTKRIQPPLEIPPLEARRTYMPDAPIREGTPVMVAVSGKGGGMGVTLSYYYPPYGGWLLVGNSSTVEHVVNSIGILSQGTYVMTGHYTSSIVRSGTIRGQLVVYQTGGMRQPTTYYVDISSTQHDIKTVSAAGGVNGYTLVASQVTDAEGNIHAFLASFQLPLAPGQAIETVEPYIGSTPGGAENDQITSIQAINTTHALVTGRLNNTLGGKHDAVVMIVSPTATGITLEYIVAFGYWDANGNPADGETAVKAILANDVLYVLGHGGISEPANNGVASFIASYNISSGTLLRVQVFGNPPTNNVTAIDMILSNDLYILLRIRQPTSTYDTLVARLDPVSLEPRWASVYDFSLNERPVGMALQQDGLRIVVDSGNSEIILANMDPDSGELYWAYKAQLKSGVQITPTSYSIQDGIMGSYRMMGVGGVYEIEGAVTVTSLLIGELNTEVPGRIETGGGQYVLYEPISPSVATFADYREATTRFTTTLSGGISPAAGYLTLS